MLSCIVNTCQHNPHAPHHFLLRGSWQRYKMFKMWRQLVLWNVCLPPSNTFTVQQKRVGYICSWLMLNYRYYTIHKLLGHVTITTGSRLNGWQWPGHLVSCFVKTGASFSLTAWQLLPPRALAALLKPRPSNSWPNSMKFYSKILSMHALNMWQIIFLISFWHPLDCMIQT